MPLSAAERQRRYRENPDVRAKEKARVKARYAALTPEQKRKEFNQRWVASLRRYGMTEVDFKAILLRQDGRCAICRRTDNGGKKFCVDHCHATGRVRGLLCSACNKGLGLFQDAPERLQQAAKYLKEHQHGSG